jgi:hypothetical protein
VTIEIIRALAWPLAFIVALGVLHRILAKWLAETMVLSKRSCELGEESLKLAKEAAQGAFEARKVAADAIARVTRFEEAMDSLREQVERIDNRTTPVPHGRASGMKFGP